MNKNLILLIIVIALSALLIGVIGLIAKERLTQKAAVTQNSNAIITQKSSPKATNTPSPVTGAPKKESPRPSPVDIDTELKGIEDSLNNTNASDFNDTDFSTQ